MDVTAVGEYLRARREVLRPEDVGIPADPNRRVSGLRREEVAVLAGISPDYYLRLEQGRDTHPSEQVLKSLARALQLDSEATAYLHRLVRPTPPPAEVGRAPDEVDDSIRQLVELWDHTAAIIINGCQDVIYSNRIAAKMTPVIWEPGGNWVLAVFDLPSRSYIPNWEELASATVAALRAGADPDDPRLHEIVGELSVNDPDFSRLWARHDVKVFTSGVTTQYVHSFGLVEFRWQNLAVPGHPGLLLTTFFGDPGSTAEAALNYLHALPD